MCDYSLEMYASRPATAGETLSVTRMGSGSIGLKGPVDIDCVACVSEGTVLRLEIPNTDFGFAIEDVLVTKIDADQPWRHHDAIRLEDGSVLSFQHLRPWTNVKVLMVADAQAPEDKGLATSTADSVVAYVE